MAFTQWALIVFILCVIAYVIAAWAMERAERSRRRRIRKHAWRGEWRRG